MTRAASRGTPISWSGTAVERCRRRVGWCGPGAGRRCRPAPRRTVAVRAGRPRASPRVAFSLDAAAGFLFPFPVLWASRRRGCVQAIQVLARDNGSSTARVGRVASSSRLASPLVHPRPGREAVDGAPVSRSGFGASPRGRGNRSPCSHPTPSTLMLATRASDVGSVDHRLRFRSAACFCACRQARRGCGRAGAPRAARRAAGLVCRVLRLSSSA